MKKVKKWRYYCDFCKKSGAQEAAMLRHEKHCTMNPDRVCRMCGIVDGPNDLPKLLALAKTLPRDVIPEDPDGSYLSDEGLQQLKIAANFCPACILAVLRQAEFSAWQWDFKEACAEMWAEYNEEHRAAY